MTTVSSSAAQVSYTRKFSESEQRLIILQLKTCPTEITTSKFKHKMQLSSRVCTLRSKSAPNYELIKRNIYRGLQS